MLHRRGTLYTTRGTLKYDMNQNQTTKLDPKNFEYGFEYTILRINNYNNKIIANTQLVEIIFHTFNF